MRSLFSRPIFISFAVCALAAAALAFMLISEVRPSKTSLSSSPVSGTNPAIGGAFTLINTNGQPISDHHYRGQYLFIYFGFTFCPDVCPTALVRMTQALELLAETDPALASAIQPLLISVDPERDTPAAMREYVRHFHPRLEGLTGSQEQIDAVTRAYRIYATKVADETATGGYSIDHSSLFYFMDRQNRFLTHFTDTTPIADMAETLRALLTEQSVK